MDGGLICGELTEKVLKAAMEVHRNLGPGLLESAYRQCLVEQLCASNLEVEREVPIAIRYKDLVIDGAYRADIIVEKAVLLELKAVDRLLPIHDAQTLTYLKLARSSRGPIL